MAKPTRNVDELLSRGVRVDIPTGIMLEYSGCQAGVSVSDHPFAAPQDGRSRELSMDQLAVRMPNPLRGRMAVFLIMVSDLVALSVALVLALVLRFEEIPLGEIWHSLIAPHGISLPIGLLAYLGVFHAFRLYKYAWRFAGLETLKGVTLANTIGLFLFALIQKAIEGHTLPRAVLIIFLMTSIASVGCIRAFLRFVSLSHSYGGWLLGVLRRDLRGKRIVILGSGSTGARLLHGLREEVRQPHRVIGFLDDRPDRHGIYIHDVCVLGPLSHLYDLLNDRAVDEVLIALPNGSGPEIREYVMACRKRKIPVKVIPGLQEVLNGKTQVRLEDISVEDLLRRPVVSTDIHEVARYITGKRVLVTGAGGSIGSELCRQIIKFKPSKLVLLGHGENSIHRLHSELIRSDSSLADILCMCIANTADSARIHQVIDEHRPHIVFHAAAHKHVPIMEINVLEAVQNNVIGTYNVAEACGINGVQHMVLISTDKAVYPSCVMGATKRVCEEILRALVPMYPNTNYVTVRFGNVLGSRGSAVPIFHEQIKRGGPVTVTHKDMTRYFMSIPEAVHLVLQAGALGVSGELYVLDMGEPVKIVDLACDMIRLCGCEPDVDIPIVFTGVRPGEKLHEALTEAEESLMPATRKGLSLVHRQNHFAGQKLLQMIREMQDLIARGDAKEARNYLHEMVPQGSSRMLVGKP